MPMTKITHSLSVASQLDREDIALIAAQGFGTIINNRPDNEEPGQLTAAEARAEAKRVGLDYIHLPVVTGSISRKDVTEFHRLVSGAARPVLAHCRSGTRCYLLWMAARALIGHEAPQTLAAEAAEKGFDLRVLPSLVEKLSAEK